MAWYKANSGGNSEVIAALNSDCIEKLPDYLDLLFSSVAKVCGKEVNVTSVDVDDILTSPLQEKMALELCKLFDIRGSDKGSYHQYHKLYAAIFEMVKLRSNKSGALLEIGLGTNNPELPSTMGLKGRPGASIRAFKDFCPALKVVGADIDESIIVEGFETFIIDQLNPYSFDLIEKEFPDGFDVIIDDGLHSPHANLTSLGCGLKLLRERGIFVVEDVPNRALLFWDSVAKYLLLAGLSVRIVRCRPDGSNCILVGKGIKV